MNIYGLSSLSEFLGDLVVYRRLAPADERLPGLEALREKLGIPSGRIPRKSEADYARVVAHLLQEARGLSSPAARLEKLIYLGDTRLLDGTAFANLCQAGGWQGLAFIASESAEPPEMVEQGEVFMANRWASLGDFERLCSQRGYGIDECTAIVVDLDKTAIGARGRNDRIIDEARLFAVEQTVAELIGGTFDISAFRSVYDRLNRPRYHPFTADNQDYLAYICLILASGLFAPDQVIAEVEGGELYSFDEFILRVESHANKLDPRMKGIHAEILAYVRAGDPTPFKAFRANEYLATIRRMGSQEEGTPPDVLLEKEIVITQEVRSAALRWRDNGALIFGLSDKPDEAAIPGDALAAQGYPPLHQAVTHIGGE